MEITDLETGANSIKYTGNITPDLEQFILEKWIEEGGAQGDIIPEDFRQKILGLYRLKTMSGGIGGLGRETAAQGGIKGYSVQGGVKNYLGDQETVSGVPVKWQSGPDKPETELAYITKAEKDLILKKDLHGSLKGGPNLGPSGVMSLDSWGDIGGGQAGAEVDSGRREDRPERTQYSPATSRSAQAMSPADVKHAERISGTDYDVFRGQGANVAGSTRIQPRQSLSVMDLIGNMPSVKAIKWAAKKLKEQQEENYWESGDELPRTHDIYHDPGGTRHGPEIQGPQGPVYMDPTYSLADAAGTTSDFDLYAALEGRQKARFAGQPMLTTGNRFIAANGGRIPYAYGGIIGSDGRRAYGLGSFVKKAFKKAKRAIKKITKSPIGKAALIGGLGYLTMGGAGSGFFKGIGQKPWAQALKAGWAGRDIVPGFREEGVGGLSGLLFKGAKWAGQNKLPLALIGGASLAGGLYTAGQEDESLDDYIGSARRGTGIDPTAIRRSVQDQYRMGELSPEYQLQHPFQAQRQYIRPDYYAAEGGRIGYDEGQLVKPGPGRPGYGGGEIYHKLLEEAMAEIAELKGIHVSDLSDADYDKAGSIAYDKYHSGDYAQGGRIGYDDGKLVAGVDTPAIDLEDLPGLLNEFFEEYGRNPISIDELKRFRRDHPADDAGHWEGAQGGRIGYAGGELIGDEDEEEFLRQKALGSLYTKRLGAQEGGLMDLGGMEKDYRNEGGFVPIGGQEKADDVPARLSKNEFVFTADAVRAAGGGDIDAGAEVMENVMKNLEQGGQVSEESQGREGAKNMFATAQRLEGVM